MQLFLCRAQTIIEQLRHDFDRLIDALLHRTLDIARAALKHITRYLALLARVANTQPQPQEIGLDPAVLEPLLEGQGGLILWSGPPLWFM